MTSTLRITKISFRAGSKVSVGPPLEVSPGPVLVLVGPNNSGKSLALREIETWCHGDPFEGKVISDISADLPTTEQDALELLTPLKSKPPQGQIETERNFFIASHLHRGQPSQTSIDMNHVRGTVTSPDKRGLRGYTTSWYTIRLDGRTRFSLVSDQPAGDLQAPPQNHLWALFVNDAARERVRKLTEDAFGLHFVVDPTGMVVFRIKMSLRKPTDKMEEQALDERARRFHSSANHIEAYSDGVQAFVGLISAVLSLAHRILLVDEPEAFLFPPLARRLGESLAEITTERHASLVVATHSSEFLIGCLTRAQSSVVRLTHQDGTATARNLEADILKSLMSDPLLRSSKVLDALFHQSVVVTESDSDRAFYDEINRRLGQERGMKDVLFLNAQNKQTEHRIVGPLRRIGIPAAAVLDLDFLEDTGPNWNRLLESALVPVDVKQYLQAERDFATQCFSQVPQKDGKPIKTLGVEALKEADQIRVNRLLSVFEEYGVFLVPRGQLENWLRDLGARGHSPDWLVDVFSKIGN